MEEEKKLVADIKHLIKTRRAVREGEALIEMPVDVVQRVLESLHRLIDLE